MSERGEVVNVGSLDMSKGVTRTEDERAAVSDRARKVESEMIRSSKAIRAAGVHFAKHAYEFLSERLWEVDYESPKEAFANPDIGCSLGYAKEVATTYREFVLIRQVPVEALLGIDLRTLRIGLPAIKKAQKTWQEVVDDAATYPRSEMQRKYGDRRGPNAPLDATEEPERMPCPMCGSFVEKDRIAVDEREAA